MLTSPVPILLALASFLPIANTAPVSESFVATGTGLKYQDLVEGSGASPVRGQRVNVHYTGWLNNFESGQKFDSSRDRGQVFSFDAGMGRVIKGWDEAIMNMKTGTRRRLVIPASLAYGPNGIPGVIPGGATLYFDVELLGIE
mmetsp:Transcript_15680/g.38653  ORF Transcript_15680/g.38653 Transcript_15680/m.38653 type:complete len:143 (+) Transcript_15680:73-501(+)